MPAASSAEGRSSAPAPAPLGVGVRLAMVLCGYLPLLHLAGVIGLAVQAVSGQGLAWAAGAAAALYLLPPLAVNALARLATLDPREARPGSRLFLVWWVCTQWQIIFNRLPFLEEALRFVPSLYSAWLRLWGARVGSLVYWSPGVVLHDRQWIDVGHRAVLGGGARIAPHFLTVEEGGGLVLLVGRVKIGHDAIVGACSLLSAGVVVAPHAVTRAVWPLRPFSFQEAGSHHLRRSEP